jgi:branched-chain amino acid transport system substrate-binding protein
MTPTSLRLRHHSITAAAFALLLGGGPSPDAHAQEVLQIPLMAPFSGQVAFYGEGYRRGLEIAFEQVGSVVNGRRLLITDVDDECKPEGAVSQVSKIIDKAIVLVGPACSGNMLAVQKTLENAGVPHIFTGYGAAITDRGDKLVFRSSISDRLMAERMIAWAKEKLGVKRWGLVHDTTGYGAGGARTFEAAAKAAGLEVVAKASYNPGEREFTGLALNVDKATPDAIHAIGYEVELGLFVKQAAQAGIKSRIIGPPPFTNPELAQAAGGHAEGLYFMTLFLPDDPDPVVQNFVKRLREKYNTQPKDVHAIGYAAGIMLIEAFKRIQGVVTRENLAKQLGATEIASSPLGPIKLNETGDRVGNGLVVIGVIKDGKPTFHSRL